MSSKVQSSCLKVSDARNEDVPSSLLSHSDQKTSAISCVVVDSKARPIGQKTEFYIPLFYSEKVKNPGKSHVVKRVLLGHWVFAVIAWSCLSPHPVVNAFSLLLLTLSYWCVYEIGYQENDDIAAQCERVPTLSATYSQYRSRINLYTPWPWVWAVMFAIPGCLLFSLSQQTADFSVLLQTLVSVDFSTFESTFANAAVGRDMLHFLPSWGAFLAIIRLTFWLYNRVNETTRVWVYPLLHVQQLFGFALLAGTNPVGILLLLSLTFSRWIKYCIYRCGGDRKRFPTNVSCLLLFTLLFTSLCLGSPDSASWLTGQAALAFAYCGLRSVKKIIKLKSSIGWLDRSSVNLHSLSRGV
ncbi:MAG: hypothetical protein AAFZ17_14295 [Cyanobacteria bacterium J06650_10]